MIQLVSEGKEEEADPILDFYMPAYAYLDHTGHGREVAGVAGQVTRR
jgi:hypothetical protein